MKNGKPILIVLVLALAAIGIAFWLLRDRAAPMPAEKRLPPELPERKASKIEKPNIIVSLSTQIDPNLPLEARRAEWNRRMSTDRRWEWKMPITFYGKVVDENDAPIAGASVEFIWNDLSSQGSSKAATQSDSAGLFSLTGVAGKGLSVHVKKAGYYTSNEQNQITFEYAAYFAKDYHYQPDPAKPVIFRLKKKGEAEALVVRHVVERLAYDKGSYYYDLQRGSLGQQPPASTALKFTFTRSSSRQGEPFDSTWKIEAINADLREHNDEFPQLAPTEGYTKEWEASGSALDEPFNQTSQAKFYVQTSDNRHARLEVELMHPNLRDMGPKLIIKSYLNPTGSRNLEYDPAKEIKPGK